MISHNSQDGNAEEIRIFFAGKSCRLRNQPVELPRTVTREEAVSLRIRKTRTGWIRLALLSLAVLTAREAFAETPLRFWFVPVEAVANRGFTDKVPYDGKGGWTDQGPDMDIDFIQPGIIRCGDIEFQIKSEIENPEKTVMVLSGPQHNGHDLQFELPLPPNNAKALYLLHAAAWPPKEDLGQIIVRYADGETETIKINTVEHCQDWRGLPGDLTNGRIAWRHKGFGTSALFASGFELKHAAPVSLSFHLTASNAIWLIPAVTLSNRFLPFPPLRPHTIVAGKDWMPIQYRWRTKSGSALDFSGLNDPPAGKYGFLKAHDDGTIRFEKKTDVPIRFYGVNVVYHACFPSHEQAERIADEFSRCGYNLARLHLNDQLMVKANAASSLDIDPERLDRIEYFFAALKKRGIYITIDFYATRQFRPGDGPGLFPEEHRVPGAMKWVAPLNAAAGENLKEFVRRWLTHVNPYTQLAWKEDPAMAFVNLLNEDTLSFVWQRGSSKGKRYEDAFNKYKDSRTTGAEYNREFLLFRINLQMKWLSELLAFTRDELKLKVPVTSLNYDRMPYLSVMRRNFDLVDNHDYFDHPVYSANYQLPHKYLQESDIASAAISPSRVMPTRIYGKPFVITEYNFCFPNHCRAEGGPIIGAYASLQNWCGLVGYRWASDAGPKEIEGNLILGAFSINSDPLMMFSNRIVSLLFRRKNVLGAKESYAAVVEPEIKNAVKQQYSRTEMIVGLIAQMGTVFKGEKTGIPTIHELSGETRRAMLDYAQTDRIVSSTKEIVLDVKANTFTINTPCALSVTLPSGTLAGGLMTIADADTFQTVTLFAMDKFDISSSHDLLLFHLTDVVNSKITFSDDTMTCMTDKGELPLLLRKGKCKVSIATGRNYQIQALACDGSVLGNIVGTLEAGQFSFIADNSRFGGVFAYSLRLDNDHKNIRSHSIEDGKIEK